MFFSSFFHKQINKSIEGVVKKINYRKSSKCRVMKIGISFTKANNGNSNKTRSFLLFWTLRGCGTYLKPLFTILLVCQMSYAHFSHHLISTKNSYNHEFGKQKTKIIGCWEAHEIPYSKSIFHTQTLCFCAQ